MRRRVDDHRRMRETSSNPRWKNLVYAALLLVAIAAALSIGSLRRVAASEGKPERRYWEYSCPEIELRKAGDVVVLNSMGEKGWEMVAVPSPSIAGAVVCFKREIAQPVPCSPACGGGLLCLRGRCVSPCTPPCNEEQFCGQDRRCHRQE
jgi:hypothetical protein